MKPRMRHLRNTTSAANRNTSTTALRILIDLPSYVFFFIMPERSDALAQGLMDLVGKYRLVNVCEYVYAVCKYRNIIQCY